MSDAVTRFYLDQLPEAQLKNNTLHAPCPFCGGRDGREANLVVFLQPDSFFHGYFRCAEGCAASGFPLHFARLRGTRLAQVPGYDPDREYFGREVDYPVRNLNNELAGFSDKLTAESAARLHGAAITARTLAELRVGHNGRYLVYPYVQPDGNCYAARCVHPERPEDFFWYGDERFFAPEYRVFNAPEIDRCENGTLFVVEGEENLLCLKQLGLPGVAVPAAADLEHLDPRRFEWIGTLFLWVGHNAESAALARVFATRAGFKVRIVRWPENAPKNASLHSLATEQPEAFQQRVFALIREARAFSPFPSPAGEFHTFTERLAQEAGEGWAGLTTGFARLDRALGGLHGLNILGGTPK
ncbi:MAG: DNA helicase, partial [Desulfobulbaceae bacterium]|nr:DNA helicase [Desulfobulbaceae bacterium]